MLSKERKGVALWHGLDVHRKHVLLCYSVTKETVWDSIISSCQTCSMAFAVIAGRG